MAMVAVGGSIGTGLLLGSAAALEVAGPAAIISFFAAAFINWTVTMALGELACAHPAAGSFGVYGEIYHNSFAGFIARAGYWLLRSRRVLAFDDQTGNHRRFHCDRNFSAPQWADRAAIHVSRWIFS